MTTRRRPSVDLPAARRAGPLAKVALVAEILVTYARTRRAVRQEELPAAVAAMREPARSAGTLTPRQEVALGLRLGRAVTVTLTALPTDSRCLTSSLVLLRVLERRGIHPRFVLAVRSGPDFAAHAWLEHEGRALLPGAYPPFERLLQL